MTQINPITNQTIHKSSNHPTQIMSYLGLLEADRNSSNKGVFNASKGDYEQALKHRAYSNISLPLQESSTIHVKRQRHRNIWFNSPYSWAVIKKNVTKFLQLLDLHFLLSNKFHKMFNRNNVKVSYCCTQNVGNIKS